jgi:murein DD-endopeptidase MepM/ murein hydrolase activator NlpD
MLVSMTTYRRPRRTAFAQLRRSTLALAGARLFAVLFVASAWLIVSPANRAVAATAAGFTPPLPPPLTVLAGFSLAGEPWQAGNRGVDLAATTGESVFAASAGTVLYAGALAGRGVISINHGEVRTTYEPVNPVVHVGDVVTQGQLIGQVSDAADNCGPPGSCLHWGAITATGYVDPMSFLGPPKIRLLPIWSDGLPDASAGAPHTPSKRRPVVAGTAPPANPTQLVAATAATTTAPHHGGATAAVSGAAVLRTAAVGALAASALAVGAMTFRRRRVPP